MMLKKKIRIYKKYELWQDKKIANMLLKKSNGKIYLCIDRLFYENRKDEEIVNTIDYYIAEQAYNIYDSSFLCLTRKISL